MLNFLKDTDEYFHGSIDELLIYNYKVSDL